MKQVFEVIIEFRINSHKENCNIKQTSIRLNKYLAALGIGSRREIDEYIKSGKVLVNKKPATLGDQVQEGDVINFNNKKYICKTNEKKDLLYIAFYKPKGLVSTCDKSIKNNIISFIEETAQEANSNLLDVILNTRIYPIGRLDKDSEGLMILTNDGKLTNQLTHPKFEHEKEYIVRCQNPISKNFINKFAKGVEIELDDRDQNSRTVVTKPCKIVQISEYEFQTILEQGYNRQIRKMTERLGNQVSRLRRIRIANISIQDNLINRYPPNIITVLKLKDGAFKKLKYSMKLFKKYDGSRF